MGKTILTTRQFNFLELATQEYEITRWFYLTGGTALSEYYLHHRLSEDIDLFTISEVYEKTTDFVVSKYVKQENAVRFDKRKISGLFMYQVYFSDGTVLKIDFNNFPFEPVERGITYKTLRIDSFYDIAINKAYTIIGRFQPRDFIDLYFILKKEEFNLEQLLDRVEEKYTTKIDAPYYASQLLRVKELPQALPTMLVPFDFDDMVMFFVKEAKRLGEKAFK